MVGLTRHIGWDGRGKWKNSTARIPNDGQNKEPGAFRVRLNTAATVIDEWLNEEGLFTLEESRAIWTCHELWRKIGALDMRAVRENRCVTGVSVQNDFRHSRALNKIHRMKQLFVRSEWEIFENVVRWGEPTGVPGSRFSVISAASITAAKEIVGSVAERLYESGFAR